LFPFPSPAPLVPFSLSRCPAVDAEGKTALKIAQEKGNTPIADAILVREKQIEQEKLAEIAAGRLAKKGETTDHRVCGGSCLIA